jgi:hypothetical protein
MVQATGFEILERHRTPLHLTLVCAVGAVR